MVVGAVGLVVASTAPVGARAWGSPASSIGAGLGLVASPSLIAAQSSVGWNERGVVTGANLFSRSMGSAVGVAALGALVNALMHGDTPAQDPEQFGDAVTVAFVAVAGRRAGHGGRPRPRCPGPPSSTSRRARPPTTSQTETSSRGRSATMGIEDLVNQAKAAVSGHEEQAKDAIEKAAEAVKAKTSDSQDAQIDSVVEKAKTYLDEQKK